MKIYTKNGDQGETSLVGGTRIHKYDDLLEAYGTVDELNAHIGLILSEEEIPFLTIVQNHLFTMGGMLATEPEKWEQYWQNSDFTVALFEIEKEIDRLSEKLEPFHHFILPQGSKLISEIHICRTICRRTERKIAKILSKNEHYLLLLKYLNRLSDYFFILARFSHKKQNIPEKYWNSAK
ncbi:MAG: cob(I)yrinic acid a,c-diamide adenosyltransferase [Bacteroidales bacterium]